MAKKKKRKAKGKETSLICDICGKKVFVLIPKADEPKKFCCQECLKLAEQYAA